MKKLFNLFGYTVQGIDLRTGSDFKDHVVISDSDKDNIQDNIGYITKLYESQGRKIDIHSVVPDVCMGYDPKRGIGIDLHSLYLEQFNALKEQYKKSRKNQMTYIPPFEPRNTPYCQIEIYGTIFARNLRYILASRGLLRTDVSEATGIPEDLIENYMYRGSVPSRKELELIAKALDVNEYWLAGHDVTPEESEATKPPNNEEWRAEAIDLLCSQMKIISEASQADEPEELSALSNSMASIAGILIAYLK